jgi:DNA polymerase-3 subunit epsilon
VGGRYLERFGALRRARLIVEDSFNALIKIDRNTEAVTVHGVTRDQSLRGVDEAVAIEQFLDYLGDGVIVGHHIGHDVSMLDAGLERIGSDVRLLNRALDTADLTLFLNQDGAFAGRTLPAHLSLDTLADLFGVIPHDRHTASGDAFITALVFLRLLKLATRHGRTTLGSIGQEFVVPE